MAEDDILIEQSQPRRWAWLKWVLALALVLSFVYRSTRPVTRLSAEPPPAFYDYSRTRDHRELQQERRLALAYWNVAVRRIQTHYSPRHPLPPNPPPQFQVSREDSDRDLDGIVIRARYWDRLRRVWNEHGTWVVSNGWNTDWVGSALNAVPRYLPNAVRGLFQGLIDIINDIAQKIAFP